MDKRAQIKSLGLLSFFLFLSFNLCAQDFLDEPIFSPVADKVSQYPASSILYKQYLENGNHYLDQGLYREAKELFWKAIHLYPQNPDAYINLGTAHMRQEDLDSALRILKDAEGLVSQDYQQIEILFYNLGKCNFLKEDYHQAIFYLEKALAEFSDFAQARYYLGVSYYRLGQNEKAFVNIFMAAEMFDKNGDQATSLEVRQFLRNIQGTQNIDRVSLAKSLFGDAQVALANQELSRAIVLMKESIFLNPNDANVYYELALIYSRENAFHNAIIYLNKAIEVDPGFTKAYLGLNQAYRKVEKYDSAVEILKAAADLDKENPLIYYNMALASIEGHDFNTARRYLTEAELGALANKDDLLLEKINVAYGLIEQYKQAKTKPPFFPKKITRKPSETLYPYHSLPGNSGNFSGGYFVVQRSTEDEQKKSKSHRTTLEY
ncbi:MAG: DUF3808 domain-containing protein [Candidatus Omnitrophica bacterium]|nr:DUF3808 domain-containing protein [Candidatus Omnitrophota bacterium]